MDHFGWWIIDDYILRIVNIDPHSKHHYFIQIMSMGRVGAQSVSEQPMACVTSGLCASNWPNGPCWTERQGHEYKAYRVHILSLPLIHTVHMRFDGVSRDRHDLGLIPCRFAGKFRSRHELGWSFDCTEPEYVA